MIEARKIAADYPSVKYVKTDRDSLAKCRHIAAGKLLNEISQVVLKRFLQDSHRQAWSSRKQFSEGGSDPAIIIERAMTFAWRNAALEHPQPQPLLTVGTVARARKNCQGRCPLLTVWAAFLKRVVVAQTGGDSLEGPK